MPFWFLVKGLLIGFSIAAPVGPIGVLCIRRSLLQGRLTGFVSGVGAATADAFYGAIAAFGLTAVSGFFINQERVLALLGGIFLLALGMKFLHAQPREVVHADHEKVALVPAYTSTVLLTLTNPTTILSFLAVFAGLGLGDGYESSVFSAIMMVLGVFLGSCAWWLILSELVHRLRSRLTGDSLVWANRGAGVILVGFGVLAILKGVG